MQMETDIRKVGNERGVSKVEFEEMELRFTLPYPENQDQYLYLHSSSPSSSLL